MRIYYDTEFYEDGRTIELLSIGLVCEDGRSLYQIVGDDSGAVSRAVNHPWLRENVVPHLPIKIRDRGTDVFGYRWTWSWDKEHPDWPHVATRRDIATRVREFVLGIPDPQLWAWYGAYDHVALVQLFGRMIELPDGFPMFTCDVRQEAARTCCDLRQEDGQVRDPGNAHNALHDAMWAQHAHEFLIGRERDHLASSQMALPMTWPDHLR